MVLSLSISEEIEAKLRSKAAAAGIDIAIFAASELERAIGRPSPSDAAAPVHQQVSASGMSNEQITDFLADELSEHRRERREKAT